MDSCFYMREKPGTVDSHGHRVLKPRYDCACKGCHGIKRDGYLAAQLADTVTAEKVRARRAGASRRWREANPEKAKAATEAWKRALRADPEAWARYREDQRINYALRRERAGKPSGPRPRSVISQGKSSRQRIAAAPLLGLIQGVLARREAVAGLLADSDGATVESVVADLGVTSRTYRRWKSDPGALVYIGVAERVLANAGVEWHEVYSYDDHADVFLAGELV